MNTAKRIVAIISLFVIISGLSPALGNRALADTPPAPIIGGVPVFNPTEYANDTWNWFEKVALNILKRRFLDQIVNQIVDWIQGNGKPRFVEDWRGFIKDAGQEAIGDFARSNPYTNWLCDPFNFRVEFFLFPVNQFEHAVTCTLDDIVENINDFIGDFRNGNWLALNEFSNPSNNFFGVTLMTSNEIMKSKNEAEFAAFSDALAGGGFTSEKTCEEDPNSDSPDLDGDGTPGDVNCKNSTPGGMMGDIVTRAVYDSNIGLLLSANELSDYIEQIANAALNRLIESGVGGLKGL